MQSADAPPPETATPPARTRNAKRRTERLPAPCAHHRLDDLPYVTASLDADARTARGERQTKCRACNRWLWPHEVGVRP